MGGDQKESFMLVEDESDRLLMVPGPTPVHRRILDALHQPTIWHGSRAMADTVRECQEGLRRLCGTQTEAVFVFGGSGTLAQEAAILNLVAPGERLLVLSNGFFGDRFGVIAERFGIVVEKLSAPWGKAVEPDELEAHLATSPCRAVTITHVDTSTGVTAPVVELARIAKRSGALVILDAVCSLGGMPVLMDSWEIDIVLSGAQKALGVPPGLAILIAAEGAMARRRALASISAFYTDLLNWEPSMKNPETYFSTHAVNLFYALREGLRMALHEGLERRFARHGVMARQFRAGMGALGFRSLTDDRFQAHTMSVLAYPAGVDDEAFREALAGHGVVASGAIGEFKETGIRFGHMGNISSADVLSTIAAAESALADVGIAVTPGVGLRAAQSAAPHIPATPI
jgi:alanine-glyoxylate transaminase/serine-glyoxylate transaminase/serine-pyruvate transaminase